MKNYIISFILIGYLFVIWVIHSTYKEEKKKKHEIIKNIKKRGKKTVKLY